MPEATGGGRRQRGRESIENELRSLSGFYRWGRPRSPRPPSSPSRLLGGGTSSNPPCSVTRRSRRRRRRGNINRDLDNIGGIASVDSSWQEAAVDAVVAEFEIGSGSGGGRGGNTSPIARSWDAHNEETQGAEASTELLPNTLPRRLSSDRLLSENGAHSGRREPRSAERRFAAAAATCQGPVVAGSEECRAGVEKAESSLDGADDFCPLEKEGENDNDNDNNNETGRVLPDRDLAGGRSDGPSESDSDGVGVERWNLRNKQRPRAGAPGKRRMIVEDDDSEEETMIAAPAVLDGSCDPLEGRDSADEDEDEDEVAEEATGVVVEEQPHPGSRRSVGVDLDLDSDGEHERDPAMAFAAAAVAAAASDASSDAGDVVRGRGGERSTADGGKQTTVASVSDASNLEDALPLESESATTATIEAGTSGSGDDCSGGETNLSATDGFDCCGSDSGSGGYCSPDAAEEWNMGTGGDVSMGAADPSSDGNSSTGDVGQNTTGGERDRPVGCTPVEPGATCGGNKSRSLATGASSRSASVTGDSDDEDDEVVMKRRGKGAARRVSRRTRRRRFVLESSDSDSACPKEDEEKEEEEESKSDGADAGGGEPRSRRGASLFQDEGATVAAGSGAGADDVFLDAEEGPGSSEAREAEEEQGRSGGGSSGRSGSEDNLSDDDAGHGTEAFAAPGGRSPRDRPRRRQARRFISDGEESSSSGGGASDLEQEGPDVTSITVGSCSSVSSCYSSDDFNVGRPRRLRGKPPAAPAAAAAAAAAAAPEGSDDASSEDDAFEDPTGSSSAAPGGGRGASRGRSATAAAASSPSLSSCSAASSWSPVPRKAGGRPLRNTDSRRNRTILSSSDDSKSDDGGGDGAGGCETDPSLSDDSPLVSPATRGGKSASHSEDLDLSLSLVFDLLPSPPRRQGGRGKGAPEERGARVGGRGAGTGRGGGSRRAQAGGSGAEELSGAAFRKARDSLTAKYFAEFNEGAFGGALSDVGVTWSARLQSTAGVTKSLRRTNASGGSTYVSVVELSTKVLDTETKLRQTLLHELCHAAAWVIDHKSKPPHGDHFWAWADRAKAAHPGVPVTTCHTYTINYKYRYVCVGANDDGGPADAGKGCGAEIGRHSKSINVQTQVCGRCRGRLALFGTHNADGKLKKPRAATGFSLFVKERYAEVKKTLPPGTKQQEVMKEISRKWAARGNSGGGGTNAGSGVGVCGGGCRASPSPRAGTRSGGSGGAAVANKGNASSVAGRGAAASSGEKENLCFFDLS